MKRPWPQRRHKIPLAYVFATDALLVLPRGCPKRTGRAVTREQGQNKDTLACGSDSVTRDQEGERRAAVSLAELQDGMGLAPRH